MALSHELHRSFRVRVGSWRARGHPARHESVKIQREVILDRQRARGLREDKVPVSQQPRNAERHLRQAKSGSAPVQVRIPGWSTAAHKTCGWDRADQLRQQSTREITGHGTWCRDSRADLHQRAARKTMRAPVHCCCRRASAADQRLWRFAYLRPKPVSQCVDPEHSLSARSPLPLCRSHRTRAVHAGRRASSRETFGSLPRNHGEKQ